MHAIPTRRIKAAVSHPFPLFAVGVIHALSSDSRINAFPWAGTDQEDADVLITDHDTALALASSCSKSEQRNCRAKLAVIAFSGRESEVRAALEAGVQGYLLSHCSQDELLTCVHMLSSGSRYLSEGAMKCVVDSLSHERLTPREITVLALLAEGLGNKAIANRLCIGLGTVKSHVVAILDKLGVSNRTQAVTEASKRGLVYQRIRDSRAEPSGDWLPLLVEANVA